MCLRLPLFEELSQEQQIAFRLVGDKTILVTGPPGTGKSVIALFRAANVQRLGDDRNPILLTFGKLLTEWTKRALADACEALEADVDRVTVKTVDSWFGGHPRHPRTSWFSRTFGEGVPRLPAARGSYEPIDWDKALEIAATATDAQKVLDLIVDEAQSVHRNFWDIVLPYCRSLTVFCDTNQSDVNPHVFSDREFAAILDIEEGDDDHWAKLTVNYRNSGNIAQMANEFTPPAPGEDRGLPDATRPGPRPVLRQLGSLEECVAHIARVAVNYPQLTHGILTTSLSDVAKTMRALEALSRQDTFSQLQYQEYRSGTGAIDPCAPGILVTWASNARGLEFDYVYTIALQNWPWPFDTATHNRMYVCMTRARTNFEIMFDGVGEPQHIQELPIHLLDRAVTS